MKTTVLEHINVTVENPDKAAALMCRLFDWKIRWQGEATNGGRSVHVGSDVCYLALYAQEGVRQSGENTYLSIGGLNHIGLVVDDLDAMEQKVVAEGLTPVNFGDYEPGRRFYFDTPDGLEIELISYR